MRMKEMWREDGERKGGENQKDKMDELVFLPVLIPASFGPSFVVRSKSLETQGLNSLI